MGKYLVKGFWFFFCLICCISLGAQQRTCGVWNPANQTKSSPAYQQLYQQKVKAHKNRMRASSRSSGTTCTSPIQLPVAVHFQGIANPDIACLRALVEDQIAIINRDFRGLNADTVLWMADASLFPGTTLGTTCLEFVLANQNHPTGYGLRDGDIAVTINTTNSEDLPNWAGYVNIVVKELSDNLGYAPLGGLGYGDAAVVSTTAFGTANCGAVRSQIPYHLGRTVVHELGHYLFLNHIWANNEEESGCAADDGIADTPIADEPNFGCPSISSSCSSMDLHMNYMDYVNDACMYMFTAGQAEVMQNWATTNLGHLIENIPQVYRSGDVPDCTDKDEDGYCVEVDCDDENSALPAATGTACDDGNPNTYNDIIQMDGCTCLGITNTCLSDGGDADADGICDDEDCNPLDACFPKPEGTPCDDGITQTSNDLIQADGCTCLGTTTIQAKLFLEGFLNTNTNDMQRDLNNKNLIPLIPPYTQAPWNYPGTEQVTTIPSNTVDWILVIARNEQDQIMNQAVGFLSDEGELLDLNGNVGITLLGGYGNYISIHHRNHLAVISATPYTQSIDFTNAATTVKGQQQLKEINGKYYLYAGDFDGNGILNNQDYNRWATNKSALNQYLPIDGDGNGIINNLDYNLWKANGAKIGYEGIQY